MAFARGDRLGPYEVECLLGAGGMGEVYRARDTRLERLVALKVLSPEIAGEPDFVTRFAREARSASALNHPSVVTVFEAGTAGDVPYIAMELLEGQSLRELMRDGPLPLRRALSIGAQVADGLAAAHERGIVHRDVKPENVFVTREGRAKLLDFGLARREEAWQGEGDSQLRTVSRRTVPGTILGTVAYMSPEQAAGRPVDFRTDLFSLGVVLYELATGRRAFRASTPAETMVAILRDEPEPLAMVVPGLPLSFRWIVERCLAKDPGERYAATRDLEADLRLLLANLDAHSTAGPGGAVSAGPAPGQRPTPLRRIRAAAVAVALVLAGSFLTLGLVALRQAPLPTFRRLTFQRGSVGNARFTTDGATVVFDAAWEGRPPEIFTTTLAAADARPLAFAGAHLLSVSRSSELALQLSPRSWGGFSRHGVLARVPLAGTSPRELLDGVEAAEFAPGGDGFAVVRSSGARMRLEFPPGRVVRETTGWIGDLRFSPDGSRLAFADHDFLAGEPGRVAVLDRDGRVRHLTERLGCLRGLAWSPDGREIWFTGGLSGGETLRAVSLAGRSRELLRCPGSLTLRDVSADGRLLVDRSSSRIGTSVRTAADAAERSISWLDASVLSHLSPDGRKAVLNEVAGGLKTGLYLRSTDGSPPVKIADGWGGGLSPDGKWVLAAEEGASIRLVLIPAGPGEKRTIPTGDLSSINPVGFLPDGREVLFTAAEEGHGVRPWVVALDGGSPRPAGPEGVLLSTSPLSPDGRTLAGFDPGRGAVVFPVDGSTPPSLLPSAEPGERPSCWSADGRSVYVYRRDEMPARVTRVDVATGRRTHFRDLAPEDPAGIDDVITFQIARDGTTYSYSYFGTLSELYVVEGVR